ncbi:MAG: hypothetical protein E7522_05705 [Ruminococcaceae bacterium]|nr:hypothetical protein [Oscillospiraceae bacterium]
MKTTKKFIMMILAVIMLFSIIAVGAQAASVDFIKANYGYMVPTDAKFTKSISTVKLYGDYDYINFLIESTSNDVYFFYEIYSDKDMTKLVGGGSTYCADSGSYVFSPAIKLKGNFKSDKTYYCATYAAKTEDGENVKVSEKSVKSFKLKVTLKPKFKQKVVILKSVKNTVDGPTITWKKLSNGTTKYVVYRKGVTDAKWKKIATVKGDTYSYTDKSIKDKNVTYMYTVKGCDKNGTKTRCQYNGLLALYAKAPKVTAVNVTTDNKIEIKWKSSSPTATYRIYRSENNGKYKLVAKNITGTTYYDDTAKNSGSRYKYAVKAAIPTEYGTAVSSYKATKNRTFLAAPELNPVVVTDNGLSISWSSVNGATGYTVYRKTLDEKAEFTELAKVDANTLAFTDTTANAQSAFSYTVRATTEKVNGSYNSKGAEYFVLGKPVITKVEIWLGEGYQKISWTGDSRTTKYNVYVKGNNDWELLGSTVFNEFQTYDTGKELFGKLEFCVEAVRGDLMSTSDSYEFESYPNVNITAKENLVAGNRLQWEVNKLAEKYNVYRATVDKETGEKTQYELIITLNASGDKKYLEVLDETAIDGVNYVYKINAFYYGEEHESATEMNIYRTAPNVSLPNEKIELESYSSYEYRDVNNYIWIATKEDEVIPRVYYFYDYQTRNWVNVFSHYANGNSEQIAESQLRDAGVYPDANGEYKMAVVYLTGDNGFYTETTSIDRNVITIKFPDKYVEEISAELESKQIKLNWKNVEGAKKYIVTYTDASYKENSIEVERCASATTYCYLPSNLEKGCTYDVKLATIYEDGSKSYLSGKKVNLHGIPKLTHVNKVVSKVDGSNLVYVHLEEAIFYSDTAILYRKAPGSTNWEVVKSLGDFHSYSTKYGYAYQDETANGLIAYTYTVRYKEDESKVGPETDIGSWYDEKGVTLKI